MTETITLIRVDDDIWVTSNDDAIGVSYKTINSMNESYQFMMALSHFLSKRELETAKLIRSKENNHDS